MDFNHDELNRTLGEILGELKGVNKRLDTANGRLSKHDEKINSLESFKDNSTGRMTVIGAFTAFVVGLIGVWVNKMFN